MTLVRVMVVAPVKAVTRALVVCDGCGGEEYARGARTKPQGWAKVLQKGDAPAKHYCNGCKSQKKHAGLARKSVCEKR